MVATMSTVTTIDKTVESKDSYENLWVDSEIVETTTASTKIQIEKEVHITEEDLNECQIVYVTKTGKKYHYSNTCNGGKYYSSTLSEAKARGLKPCDKCVN